MLTSLLMVIFLALTPLDSHCMVWHSGKASWYGKPFHGRRTANGEIYNMYKLTAAHRSLPFGTRVIIINKLNNKSVVVRINDRGPFIKGRIIDVSYAAAKELGMIKRGVIPVRICYEEH